jgi:putative aldouronate transport system substrate-binding protein
MKNKQWLSLIVCGALIVLPLSACSGNNKNTNSSPSSEASESASPSVSASAQPSEDVKLDPVKIDWFVNLSWWKYTGDWGNDKFSQYVKDTFGLDINFITPATDDGQKLAAMIAADSIPDIITVEGWKNDQRLLIKPGLVQPMNDLIAKYTPDFKPYQDVFDWYKEADGKTYGLPNYAYSKLELKEGERLEPNTSFTLRKDIYEKIGSPDVSTPDNFLAALEKVKSEVKTYDGKPLIPLQLYDGVVSSMNWLAQYFSTPFEDKDGNWIDIRMHENYYQGLKLLNTAYNKGLISKENFSETRDQINEKVASGRVFSLMTASQDFDQQFRTLYNADNNAQYQTFVVKNYNGDEPYLQDLRGFGWLYTMVSKDTKYADRIMKFIAFLNSKEGQYMTNFGWEGETYNVNSDGKFEWTDAFNSANKDGSAGKKWGIGFNMQADWLTVKDLYAPSKEPVDIYSTDMKKPLLSYSYDFNANNNRIDPGDPRWNEMNQIKTQMELLWSKELPRMIMSKNETELKANYDKAVAQMKKIGWDKWYAFQNEGFKKTKEILGVQVGWPGNL